MKHAYLIITHRENVVLERLLMLLDKENNGIYIHVDAKTKNFDFEKIKKTVKLAKLVFTNRTKVYWGDYSQVNAELVLLKTAIGGGRYDYYHLLSGQDLPIKNNSAINAFFEQNNGKEFVSIVNDRKPVVRTASGGVFSPYSRLSLFNYGVKWWRKNKILKGMEYVSLLLQKELRIDRISKLKEPIYYGANWFSITDLCARYVVSQEQYIIELFSRHTRCADELFLQTVLMNSIFQDRVTGDNLRYVDFKRGKPYVWRELDKDELLSAQGLFARKFDDQVDSLIIEDIYAAVKEK